MKLVTFDGGDGLSRPGVLRESDQTVIDLSEGIGPGTSLNELIEQGDEGRDAVQRFSASPPASAVRPLSEASLLAPLPRPKRNIFCVGKNYHEHAKEFHGSGFDASAGKDAIPECPIFFSKSYTSVIGPGEAIPASADWTNSVDYEVELAVVIGKGGRSIKSADAYDHVFGYMIINDVTSRTLQHQHKQWFLGKNFDGFCPMGPWLVTADDVGDVGQLNVTTHVNGELRQDARVADLIFDIPTLIETLSAVLTLEPGDIIATGTPAGVGIGFSPPKFLQSGDHVAVAITGLGELANPVA
ncbi:MAG: fumarylacetoacetate hydrolase family protein [Hyphomicrobiaceae bacterium]